MALRSRVFIVLFTAMVRGGTIHADMMPVSPRDAGPCLSAYAAPCRWNAGLSNSSDDPRETEAFLCPTVLPRERRGNSPRADEIRAVRLASDGQNSFGLCLYALLSLGLCRSVPLVKRFSFGFIPHWYQDGGPVRVGECLAISPDCFCAATAGCFLPPDGTAHNPVAQYRSGGVARLWLHAQFTPTVRAARAPPFPSGQLSV